MKTELIPITELSLDPTNARKHSEKNLDAIKGSLRRFGQQKPVVIDKNGVVIAGNGTVEAAKALGWEKVAVVRSDLKGTDRMAYALADNRTTDLSTWDDDVLGKQLQALFEDDFELPEIGFDPGDYGLDTGGAFDNDLDDPDKSEKTGKYVIEIEFPDEQAMRDEFEILLEKGLIARLKLG